MLRVCRRKSYAQVRGYFIQQPTSLQKEEVPQLTRHPGLGSDVNDYVWNAMPMAMWSPLGQPVHAGSPVLLLRCAIPDI